MKAWVVIILFCLSSVLHAADVLVMRSAFPEFEKLGIMIQAKVGSDYKVAVEVVDKSIAYEDFRTIVKKSGAKVIVVMDNQALMHLQRFFKENPQSKVRGIATMGLNLKDLIPRNKYIAGVAYEIAGYLTIKGFNETFHKKVKRIVGVYRSSVSKVFAAEAKSQLAVEKIDMRLVDVDGLEGDDLISAIRDKIEKLKPDVIWLVNDNRIINSETISSLWLDIARDRRTPILCGIQKLSRELGLCVYTETPTLQGISEKVSDIIYGYIDDKNDADFYGVEYIQETERATNKFLREKLGLGLKAADVIEYSGEVLQK